MADIVIFPPRPRGKMQPLDLPYYEASGLWLAQPKYNDSRTLLHHHVDGRLTVHNRHGGTHVRWQLTSQIAAEIRANLRLDPKLEYWLDGGVMNKHRGGKGQFVFFDVLQAGRYFFGRPTQVERLQLLDLICNEPRAMTQDGWAYQISENLWMSPTWDDDFVRHYQDALAAEYVEGLVLRQKDSALDNYGRLEYECDWMIRCRKPSGKYHF